MSRRKRGRDIAYQQCVTFHIIILKHHDNRIKWNLIDKLCYNNILDFNPLAKSNSGTNEMCQELFIPTPCHVIKMCGC